jgi:phage terminase small subunit
MALTDKQEKFVIEYLKCFNATQAAKKSGYSEKTAYSQGGRLLKDVEIAARVREYFDNAAMTANEALYHIAEIARGDIDNLVDSMGNPDMEQARAAEKTGLIKKIRQRTITTTDKDGHGSETQETEIEMHDRLRALELIGKHHKLFTDKTEVTGAENKPIQIEIIEIAAKPTNSD